MLRSAGHEVRTATDGVTALEMASAFRPRMAILDIGMPKLNGYEVARKIRAVLGDEVMLVAVTAWGQEEDKLRARDAGFDHHLTKPADFPSVEKLVAQIP
jgi:DNA-binding response OmpR family regulator